jgi:MFS family permease
MVSEPRVPGRVWHRAWTVAAVTLGALVAAAAFRSSTGVLMEPIEREFGWDRTTTSGAVSLNLVLFGLVAPFAAALMDRWGVRRTVTLALGLVGLASAATTVMTEAWHLWLLWGLVIGTGTGMMALVFGAIVANRWFVRHRGLVMGIFSAGNATGQLVFLPIIAAAAAGPGWRTAALTVAGLSLLMMVAVAVLLHEHPHDLDLRPLGADDDYVVPVSPHAERPVHAALRVLRDSSRRWSFWALMGTFFVCGWSTNGLIQTHFVPAAHDHGMPTTTAAGLLALVGIFDIVGTIASGWLTDRMDPRILLAIYYAFRGLSLFTLHSLLAPQVEPQLWVFIVFYGLDWVATVPPTVALCREHFGLHDSGIVFGWTFASHMVGAGAGASFAGWVRSANGSYEVAWYVAGAFCLVAAAVAMTIRKQPAPEPERVAVSA